MDIDQIKVERQKLAANIGELVNGFQKLTKCTVESVSLQHLITDAERQPIKTLVEVKIGIE